MDKPGACTYRFQLNFENLDAFEFQDFAWSLIREYNRHYKRVISDEGLKYSFQNPENYLHHLRLFLDPQLVKSYLLVCGKNYLYTSDKELVNFLTLLFENVKFSPLLPRVHRSLCLDPYEYATYYNSNIFNTTNRHNGDPRVFY